MTKIKENFCGACIALPIAFLGAGSSTLGSKSKHRKKVLLISLIVTVISAFVTLYFLMSCKTCR